MNFQEAIDFTLALPDMERHDTGSGAVAMSLNAMKALLHQLGNPHLSVKTIHVTGSKGKGSVSNLIAAILTESGFQTALYTSPHLQSFRERICLNLCPVSEEDWAAEISAMEHIIAQLHGSELGPISTFGVLTALFFQLSKRFAVDWQVVEVGMGGENDATNVFESTEIAVITAISLEHTAILGSTREEIARQKAGIIKPGTRLILARQKDRKVVSLLKAICEERGASFLYLPDWYQVTGIAYDAKGQKFQTESPYGTRSFSLSLLGQHQIENALCALAVADCVRDHYSFLPEEALQTALAQTQIAGRLERLVDEPLTIVDGAHNGDSAEALVQALSRHFNCGRCIFILAVNKDKNLAEILSALAPTAALVIATRSDNKRSMPVENIVEAAKEIGLPVEAAPNCAAALELAKQRAAQFDAVVVTGSLYLVAEARSIIGAPVTTAILKPVVE